ncbi:MAG: tryptophan synthase subunit alpha, partial [Oscillospiraceae bacterium]|nr:tryptophan synthase subunit alpha [Oscillospiraceae bacterium]
AIGFGISTPEQAKKMSQLADGVIVGAAIVRLVEKFGESAAPEIGKFAKSMTDAVH